MNQYYKPLENLNQADTILFRKIGSPEQGKFGLQHKCDVNVNGVDMTWTLSSDKHSQLTGAGFKEGDTVIVQKWKDGVKKGYNFVSPDKSNPYAQSETAPAQPVPPPPTQEAPKGDPD